ncbi:hypothetical protein PHISCL_03892 [Aspergillus sclerotialis]|uniref:GPI mannosyltransferase 1 n=1 Tax=Aspergillus sclerotialis TaxID=2070753 RepID=A0A3A2ZKS4_9EURO|nr:hypothetical protein PHISCL_03892 [Aspergillus sclerotialis]
MSLFNSPKLIFSTAIALRAILLLYGAWQDAHSALKYTDIDYMVFTDAAKYVANGSSPYNRDTYRYTPILAWFLIPTSWGGASFLFGKVLFALADVLAGFLAFESLRTSYGLSTDRALKFASVWLLNPMVANISTRGSSEGVLGVLVSGLVWAALNRKVYLAGMLLGLATHFKIYPFVYGVSIVWWLDSSGDPQDKGLISQALDFLTPKRLKFTLSALSTFSLLNLVMYHLYGIPFLHHTFLHHLTRIDHRHNFSPYSTLLYLSASGDVNTGFEGLAFLPQLFLVLVAIPLVLGRRSLTGTLLAQTFAFVGFNKVCTSQYFLWYLIFLPYYLPSSSLVRKPALGVTVGILWAVGQALWLQQGYYLEFLGRSTFVPGLFLASLSFFVVNVWILGIIVTDVGYIVGGKGKGHLE